MVLLNVSAKKKKKKSHNRGHSNERSVADFKNVPVGSLRRPSRFNQAS